MAYAVAEGMKDGGASAELYTAGSFSTELADSYEAIAFGCPAMGAEELEPSEFEPLFAACESHLAGKRIGLFGSYGWGDGEWMRNWSERCTLVGADLLSGYVICCGEPDGAAITSCKELGRSLAE